MQEFNLIHEIQNTFDQSIKLSIFQFMKTGNVIIDAFVSTFIFILISYIIKHLSDNNFNFDKFYNFDLKDNIKSLFYKKNLIILEGKRFSTISASNYPIVSTSFSDTFKAVWHTINININKVEQNLSIYELREFCTLFDSSLTRTNINISNDNIYIISQKKAFLLDKELEIYALTQISHELSDNGNSNSKSTTRTDIININLFSYKTSLSKIKNYINDITFNYLENLEYNRNIKKFIYTLTKTEYQYSLYECWTEYPFESNRTFNNIFFENKEQVLSKIEFFINNKDWYYNMGIPYSLGIGLYGPPGTGKTSFFKCLANMTKRHIVILSFKLIKTKRQLDDFFFENRYNNNNKPYSVGFDKKIIIIEDIDCLGEIVCERKSKNEIENSCNYTNNSLNVNEIIQTIVKSNIEQNKLLEKSAKNKNEDDIITLDDILNLWDGLKETPGRILGISSNHYDKLDSALIRPGRIDINLKLDNVSRTILKQMYEKYYIQNIDETKLNQINEYFYSPAEIINCYVMNKDNPENFMKRLMQNIKF
jgi:ATP-dependent Zn protease